MEKTLRIERSLRKDLGWPNFLFSSHCLTILYTQTYTRAHTHTQTPAEHLCVSNGLNLSSLIITLEEEEKEIKKEEVSLSLSLPPSLSLYLTQTHTLTLPFLLSQPPLSLLRSQLQTLREENIKLTRKIASLYLANASLHSSLLEREVEREGEGEREEGEEEGKEEAEAEGKVDIGKGKKIRRLGLGGRGKEGEAAPKSARDSAHTHVMMRTPTFDVPKGLEEVPGACV